jgi:hypothetical protein
MNTMEKRIEMMLYKEFVHESTPNKRIAWSKFYKELTNATESQKKAVASKWGVTKNVDEWYSEVLKEFKDFPIKKVQLFRLKDNSPVWALKAINV